MERKLNVNEIKNFSYLKSFYESLNSVLNENNIPQLDDLQIKVCNYLGADGLRYINSLGYLLHAIVMEQTNIHSFLLSNPGFIGVIIHSSKFGYNESPISFGVNHGKIIYTKCMNCLDSKFDSVVDMTAIAIYAYDSSAICKNYYPVLKPMSISINELIRNECKPLTFNDTLKLIYTSIYCLSTMRRQKIIIPLDNCDAHIKFFYRQKVSEILKTCSKYCVIIIHNDDILDMIGCVDNKFCNKLKEMYLDMDPQVCCICFENFDEKIYLELMTEEELNFLDEPIPVYNQNSEEKEQDENDDDDDDINM